MKNLFESEKTDMNSTLRKLSGRQDTGKLAQTNGLCLVTVTLLLKFA